MIVPGSDHWQCFIWVNNSLGGGSSSKSSSTLDRVFAKKHCNSTLATSSCVWTNRSGPLSDGTLKNPHVITWSQANHYEKQPTYSRYHLLVILCRCLQSFCRLRSVKYMYDARLPGFWVMIQPWLWDDSQSRGANWRTVVWTWSGPGKSAYKWADGGTLQSSNGITMPDKSYKVWEWARE